MQEDSEAKRTRVADVEASRVEKRSSSKQESGAQPAESKRTRASSDVTMMLAKMSGAIDVSEMYSPPRVTKEASKHSLNPGLALDLLTGWDFGRAEDRDLAWKHVKEEEPMVVIGSPMCTMFSSLQNLKHRGRARRRHG